MFSADHHECFYFLKRLLFSSVWEICVAISLWNPTRNVFLLKFWYEEENCLMGKVCLPSNKIFFFTLLCISYLYPYFPDAQYFSLSTIIEKSILIKYKNSPQFTLDSFCVQMKTKLRCMISKNEKSSCNKMTLFTFYDLNLIHFLVFVTKSKWLIWIICVNVYFQNKWLWKRLLSDHI